MFSTTIMASSTTIPTESTTASNVSKLIEKPNNCIRKIAPIREIGIVMIGTSTVRIRPIKQKMTTITMIKVSASVLTTSKIDSSL